MAGDTGRLVPNPAPSPTPEQIKGAADSGRVRTRGGGAGRAGARDPRTWQEVVLASLLTSGLVNVEGGQLGPSALTSPRRPGLVLGRS